MVHPDLTRYNPNRRMEWPIVRFWYTSSKGKTIEEIIDRNPSFFEWAVGTFQNVTPAQALYYHQVTGKTIHPSCIQDVTPYEYQSGDPEEMYGWLCEHQDLDEAILRYRGVQFELFQS